MTNELQQQSPLLNGLHELYRELKLCDETFIDLFESVCWHDADYDDAESFIQFIQSVHTRRSNAPIENAENQESSLLSCLAALYSDFNLTDEAFFDVFDSIHWDFEDYEGANEFIGLLQSQCKRQALRQKPKGLGFSM